ncbi:SRPBCC family protein [Streptomyces sp. NPDC050617]|uniref:SRPBCC family protein n=1 Tax=Streptomyces sp. NPDC050617 TaxID=3154628 RepID=UPI00341646C4
MAPFLIECRTRLPADEAWRRLTDWKRHAAYVPLTRITVTTPPPSGTGTRFTARTRLGPLAVDDLMEVVRWQPPSADAPGRCRLEKRGRAITGWAEIEVYGAGAGARARWTEELRVRGMPRALDAPTAWAGRLVFGRVVRRLLDA